MKPVGTVRGVRAGYIGPEGFTRLVPSVSPGNIVYYRIDVTYPSVCGGLSITQASTTIALLAGGGTFPLSPPTALRFPTYLEWPDFPSSAADVVSPRVFVRGETLNFTVDWVSYYQCIRQWRKDGQPIAQATNTTCPSSQNFYLTSATLQITNIQPSDAGVYDFVGDGVFYPNNGEGFFIGNKFVWSVWLTNGEGVFRSPRTVDNKFICNFDGAPTRNYEILTSTNLTTWISNFTISITNPIGTAAFTNSITGDWPRFYRAKLLPIPY